MNGGLVRGLMTMAIGVLLIVMGDGAMELLVRLVGVAFFLPALVSFISVYSRRKEAGKFTSMAIAVIDIGCMAFGLWLLVNPFSFQSVFVKLLAVILLVIALFQVYEVLSTSLRRSGGRKMLVAPLLIAAIAVYLFFWTSAAISLVAVIIGVVAVVSALSDIVLAIMLRKATNKELVVVDDATVEEDSEVGQGE